MSGKGKHNRLESQLSKTFDSYVGPNRITTPVFKIDAKIAGQTQRKASDVADNLATADEALAQTAFADAVAVHERLSSDSNVEYDTKAVERHLEQADKALTKGGSKPVARIQRSRRAWTHAQQALDIMDEATAPHVTITTREDPQHEVGYVYQLNGTVTDVRTFELQTVSVKFADGTSKTVELETQTSPFSVGTFNTTLTLEKRVNEITVSATDSNAHLGTRDGSDGGAKGKKGKSKKRDSKKSTQSPPSTTGADTLLLDADLLPDYYEQSVTGTNPLAVDSDSSHTDANEAHNRVIDGLEDFDDDDVTTYVEYLHEIDPFDPDTDDDQLTDRFELDYANLDPAVSDTDGDGTPDGADDNEPEGLTNVREQAFGTNPNDPDTDDDGLLDSYEVDTTKTVPTLADSNSKRTSANESANGILDGAEDFDNDTLETALEQNISTDPFDVDTDDDQLTDPFEYRFETIDPTTADTDGDGTADTIEDPDGETLVNIDEQRNGTIPTDPDTDDDKLTDAYEIRTTGTVPVDADSDSSVTERSEANNGVNDGMEDFDGESLRTHVEQNLGTDPFDVDTDDDELTDAFEHRFDTIEPLLADTDGDGLPDGQEDPDNESLVNVREQQYGTLPLDADTDDDDLTDKYEVDTVLTNPVVPDSDSEVTEPNEASNDIIDGVEDFDNDGLPTALEFEAGTAPFDADSDDDGLLDGFEYEYDTLDPLNADTDGDGVSDAQEDPDGEALVNIDEQAASTNPLKADTDGDTLTDAFEVRHSLTLPTDVDSSSSATNVTEADNGIRDDKEDLENDTLSNAREQTLGTDPLAEDTDEDGLTDAFEVETTETNPLNANSDSPLTETDDAANNVTDGLEDFDADAVENHYEELFGTDPFDEDTDDDSITDGFEVRFTPLDPTAVDGDGDGIPDAREDFDNDSLDTVAEEAAGTDPTANDTDFDTLSDAAELNIHGTNPIEPDTDGDGLRDDEELELGTDPTVGDTDGDGQLDGDETFTTTATNESVGVAVDVLGTGNVAETVTIRNNTEAILNTESVAETSVSKPLEFKTDEEFESAEISIDYDASKVEDERDVAVYRWSPEQQTFVALPSTVDTDAETVTAETSHFSTYVALSTSAWESRFEGDLPENYSETGEFENGGWECTGTAEVCDSNSGGVTIGSGPSTSRVSSKKSGDGTVGIQCIPTPDLGCIPPDYGTDPTPTPTPVQTTRRPVDDDDDADDDHEPIERDTTTRSQYGRALTLPNAADIHLEADVSGQAKEEDAYAEFVIVSESGDVEELFRVDGVGEGRKQIDTRIDQFAGERVSFRLVAQNESSITLRSMYLTYDSDGDGLSDNVEQNGIRTGRGETLYTNPYSSDTDGDGLSDGREVGERTNTVRSFDYEASRVAPGGYFLLDSDPTEFDTDNDGLSDYEETFERQPFIRTTSAEKSRQVLGASDAEEMASYFEEDTAATNPLLADGDYDGLTDREEITLSTNPDSVDTDGDGISDGKEVQYWETDPTLHDFRPPEVTIHQAKFGTGLGYSEYAILYGAEDPSGVTRVQFIKEGEIHEYLQFDGRPTNIGGRVYFKVGFLETSADAVTGTTVDITAEDVHNSKTRQLAVERANFYGNLAGELDHSNIYTQTAAYQLAQISGFTSSWGSTAREAKQGAEGTVEAYQALREDPVGYLHGVVRIVEVLERYGILDTLAEAFVGPLQEKQETNNPYDEAENPTLYSTYKVGWYEGFVAGKVSQIVVTFGAGQAVKGTTTAKRVDGFVSSTKTYKIAKRIKSPYDTTKARVAAKLVDGTQRVGSGVLGRTRTVAQHIRVTRALRRTDIDTSDLSDSEQRVLGGFVAQTGSEGAEFVEGLSPRQRRDFFNSDITCGGLPSLNAHVFFKLDCGGLSEREQTKVLTYIVEENRETALETKQKLDAIDGGYRFVLNHKQDGAKVASNLEVEQYRLLVNPQTKLGGVDADLSTWQSRLVNQHRAAPDGATQEYLENLETAFDNDVENPDSLIEEIDGLYVNSDGTFFETERTAHYVRDGFNVELEPGRGNINYIDMRVTSNGESQFIEQKSISESASSRKITDRLSGVNGKFDQTKFNKKEVDLSDGPHIVELRLNRGVSRNEQNPFQTVRSGVEQYFADLDSDDPIRIDEVRIFLRKDDGSYRVYRAVIDSEGIHWK
ncbi:hypothetical protein HSB1_42480 [Halogranum salarium B-1]|uniref:Uncharacterized protein n=1 Tax=Halogranum salarium B-1 TaxID=1210908 RepID=J2Z9H5_9EURY|nr:hypothetical protein HSB1_42480 [Halogranum salarium B-1]